MNNIKFGTDGWRGIISENFTFKNVKIAAQAIADHVGAGKNVAIGYDTRFMSKDFAYLVGTVLSGNGINVFLSSTPTPTPMVSYFVRDRNMAGGVMITASHNPGIYNGVKFKEPQGCSSLPSTTHKIELLLGKNTPKNSESLIKNIDMSDPYIKALKKYISSGLMKQKKLKIVIDSMYGAGGYYLEEMLKLLGHKVFTIHGEPNPIFPGMNPEPIPANMKQLSEKVIEVGADIGIATDGDADRVGIVDDRGNILTPHYVLSLLILHLKVNRKWSGAVVKTISSTVLIDKIAEKYNMPVKETPVGFKYIAELMLSSDILIGGEESGGNGFKNHIPERDGFLSGLLLVEMLCERKKKLSYIIKDMENEFGAYNYKRIDLHVPRDNINRLFETLKNNPPKLLAGNKVTDIKTFDGTKFIFSDQSWLLIRASGTEPILRLYSEGKTKKQVAALINAAQKLI
jgi:phosphomannomutase